MRQALTLPDDDDLEAGLAAGFGFPPPPVLAAIERSAGTAVPRVTLRRQSADGTAAGSSAGLLGNTVSGRASYRLEGEIAQGGMGVLLRCRDLDLGREVALKVLREDLASRPEFVQRFVEEAQIGGQLQHPGIVPVYELGLMADQRPYFAMKLVRGRTLANLLAERRGVERRQLLDVFASVCQTMAYTHARGVVHRDLKPDNILIGGFGEVQVIDWGLAKVLSASGAASESAAADADSSVIATVRSGSSSSGTPSIAGSVMGTPAYMSPEQARGETGRIDERSDVFALGAILCEILTGDPPYRGAAQRTFALAGAAQIEDAHRRLALCDADGELIDLCRVCLAPDLAERPRSAGEVALRVQSYLASLEQRARGAEVRAAELRVRARSTAILVALASAAVVVALGGAWAWRESRARRASEIERTVGAALADATLARGREDWTAAEAALALAQARSESPFGSAALRTRVAGVRDDVERELRADRAREELARDNAAWLRELQDVRQPEGDQYPTDWAALDRDYAALFGARGVLVDEQELERATDVLAQRGISVELAAALDEWSSVRQRALDDAGAERLRRIAGELDPDPLRSELRAAQTAKDFDVLREIAEHARTEPLPPQTLRLLAHDLRSGPSPELAIELLRAGCLRAPDDYALALELGRALRTSKPPRGVEAQAAYQVALSLRPESLTAWHELGITLYPLLGRTEEAVALFREAVVRFPEDGHLHFHLGTALASLGRNDEAAASLQRATADDPGNASAWCNLAIVLGQIGREEEAVQCFERSLEIEPEQLEANHDLGITLRKLGRIDEAIERFERVLELVPGFASAHTELAYIHLERGEPEAAETHARRAIELDPSSHYDHYSLGRALRALGRAAEARAALERSVELAPNFASSRRDLALVLLTAEHDAVRDAELALEHARRVVALEPGEAEDRAVVGIALYANGDLHAAREAFEREEELDPGAPSIALFRGLCALRLGHEDEGYTILEAIDLDALVVEQPVLARFVEEARKFLAGD